LSELIRFTGIQPDIVFEQVKTGAGVVHGSNQAQRHRIAEPRCLPQRPRRSGRILEKEAERKFRREGTNQVDRDNLVCHVLTMCWFLPDGSGNLRLI
jgi:hypothetical protein